MIVGLLHSSNYRYQNKVTDLLRGMADRADTDCQVILASHSPFNAWRDALVRLNKRKKIDGIVIFDEKVPTAIVFRSGHYPDTGNTDNLYGNFTKQFKDKNGNGRFEVEDMPEDYTQDAWVCRLVPYSVAYSGVGWLRWFFNQGMSIIAARGSRRDYGYMLDYWKTKLNRKTKNPLSSFVATSDWSGIAQEDSENKMGFHLNIETLKKEKVFNGGVWGTYHMEFSDPEHKEGIERMWHVMALGTAWHAAHSAGTALGDFRYDEAFKRLKSARGPTLLLTLACSVGEWEKNKCFNIVSNIYNSKENNNIKAIISSGLMQWGGGFQTHLNPDGNWTGGQCFFDLMKKHKGQPLGLAHRDWLERAYPHYQEMTAYSKHKRLELLLQFLCMNITGDATVLL